MLESVTGIDQVTRIPGFGRLRYSKRVVVVHRMVSGDGVNVFPINPTHGLPQLDIKSDGIEGHVGTVGIASYLNNRLFAPVRRDTGEDQTGERKPAGL